MLDAVVMFKYTERTKELKSPTFSIQWLKYIFKFMFYFNL